MNKHDCNNLPEKLQSLNIYYKIVVKKENIDERVVRKKTFCDLGSDGCTIKKQHVRSISVFKEAYNSILLRYSLISSVLLKVHFYYNWIVNFTVNF